MASRNGDEWRVTSTTDNAQRVAIQHVIRRTQSFNHNGAMFSPITCTVWRDCNGDQRKIWCFVFSSKNVNKTARGVLHANFIIEPSVSSQSKFFIFTYTVPLAAPPLFCACLITWFRKAVLHRMHQYMISKERRDNQSSSHAYIFNAFWLDNKSKATMKKP